VSATTKQVRHHYVRVRRAYDRLQQALNDAHTADVIVYDQSQYATLSPCQALHESERRFEASVEKQLLNAIKNELTIEVYNPTPRPKRSRKVEALQIESRPQ